MTACESGGAGDRQVYAVRMTASICRSQPVNWFQLLKVWSTISKSLILND
jgi:hypothetical protein